MECEVMCTMSQNNTLISESNINSCKLGFSITTRNPTVYPVILYLPEPLSSSDPH